MIPNGLGFRPNSSIWEVLILGFAALPLGYPGWMIGPSHGHGTRVRRT
jgi:hypothetical protein